MNGPTLQRHALLHRPQPAGGIPAASRDPDHVQLPALDLDLAHVHPVAVVEGLERGVEEGQQLQVVDLVAETPILQVDAATDEAVPRPGDQGLAHVTTLHPRGRDGDRIHHDEHTLVSPRAEEGRSVRSGVVRPPQGRAAAAAAASAGSAVLITKTTSPFVVT